MFVADYVLMEYGTGAIMAVPAHDERDYAFAVAFDCRSVRSCRRRRETELRRTARPRLRRRHARRLGPPSTGWTPSAPATRSSTGWTRGDRPRVGQLPPARLAGLPPALLGMPDPDRLLRALRHGAGARRRAARAAAGHRGLHSPRAARPSRRRGLGEHELPALRQRRAPRDRHDGHVRRLQLVLPALLRRAQRAAPGTATRCASGCPSTSTSAASSTRSCISCTRASSSKALADMGLLDFQEPFQALFTQGMVTQGRPEDEQVRGNVVRPRRSSSASAPTRPAATSCSSARPTRMRPGTRAARGRPPVPRAAVAPGGPRRPSGPARRPPAAPGARRDPQGDALTLVRKANWAIEKVSGDMRAVRLQHRDRRGHGARQRLLSPAREADRCRHALRARHGRVAAVPVRSARRARTSTSC